MSTIKRNIAMKKLLILCVAVLTATMTANAGNILGIFNVGGRIGIVSSSEQVPTTSDGIAEAIKADGTGWTGTVFARVNIPSLPLYIQPELQYTNTTITIPIVTDNSQNTEKHTYIDLPVLLGAEFGLGSLASVRINAGPVFAIASDKGVGDLVEDDFISAYNDPTMSWTAGLGVTVLSFTAEVRYNGNFVDGKIDTDNIMGSIDTNRTSWSLSLGVVF